MSGLFCTLHSVSAGRIQTDRVPLLTSHHYLEHGQPNKRHALYRDMHWCLTPVNLWKANDVYPRMAVLPLQICAFSQAPVYIATVRASAMEKIREDLVLPTPALLAASLVYFVVY